MVTDPDADRLGVVIDHHGKPITLNGHQLAALGTYYLCDTLRPKKGGIVTTIVTTPLIDKIAKAYQVKTTRVLTGFKYIGEKMREWQKKGPSFIFGAEESFGYLIGTTCRDKDGIAAACLFAEIAADQKRKKKRFWIFSTKSTANSASFRKKPSPSMFPKEKREQKPSSISCGS